MPDINIGAITEALNDKEDRDLKNTDTDSGADAVIEFQRPTAENGYTWYRKYASGWVEQGGIKTGSTSELTIDLPVEMIDLNYTTIANPVGLNSSNLGTKVTNYSTTQIKTYTSSQGNVMWIVEGMSAN